MRVCGKLCHSAEVVTLSIEGEKIAEIQPGNQNATLGGPDVWLSPGFCDLQINGYGGSDFNQEAWGNADEVSEDLYPIFQHAAKAGTPLLCPTITTNRFEAIQSAFAALSKALNADKRLARAVPGFHLEGPWIASEDGPRGAHPLAHVCDPDWDEFQRWQEAAEGRIVIVTLAPERAGAIPMIERLAAAGIVVALGHTGAEPEIIQAAVQAGARLSTHLGNGAHAQIRRHPNYIWEQLACDDLSATLIADGYHLPGSVVKCFTRVKGHEKIALVSDALALGGMPPGLYHNGRIEVLPSGKIVLANTPYLSGAGHLLDVGVANLLRFSDWTLAQVIGSVTEVPARLLGMGLRKGYIRPRADADLTLFRIRTEGPLDIEATLCAGEVVYRKDSR